MKIHLLIIDPQRDFVDPRGSLYVPGAEKDMARLSLLVSRLKDKIDDITITLDSHQEVDISHPLWFRDASGNHPSPFTQIAAEDVVNGKWLCTWAGATSRTVEYLRTLQNNGRYAHTIWPEHCLIGTEGHNVSLDLNEAVHEWKSRFAIVNYVTKGSNIWTEHFSAVRAEVPDPEDPATQVNTRLISSLEDADVILLAGEARSHCVANTVRDIAGALSDQKYIQKLVLLTDAMSDVPDPPGTTLFSDLGKAFVRDLTALGMRSESTTGFLAAI